MLLLPGYLNCVKRLLKGHAMRLEHVTRNDRPVRVMNSSQVHASAKLQRSLIYTFTQKRLFDVIIRALTACRSGVGTPPSSWRSSACVPTCNLWWWMPRSSARRASPCRDGWIRRQQRRPGAATSPREPERLVWSDVPGLADGGRTFRRYGRA
jgi:hypothetical protein